MPIWNQFRSILFGGAIGAAARTAIEPQIEPARQQAWSHNQNRILELEVLGVMVAQGLVDLTDAEDEAHRQGYTSNRLHAVAELAQKAPPVAEALTLRRRGRISPEDLQHAFAKAQVEPRWWPELARLVDERLSPQVVALAIVRGLIPDPGILPVGPPSAVGRVKAFPVFDIDAIDEAKSEGFNLDRLSVLTGIAGRPMGPEAAASAVFREIIDHVDYDRAIAEGDVRNEWAEAIFETARQIPSVADYVNARIRGWITDAEMYAGTARHGMSQADTHLLYLRTGRPAAPGQMATAAARGIDGPDGKPMDRAQFLKGIAESDIRPEWGPMLWDARFLYPPLFQLTRLVQAGAIDADTAAEWARKDRYPPEVVTALHEYWSKAPSAASETWTNRARSRLFTVTHNEFLDGEITEAGAIAVLESIGASNAEANSVIDLWTTERGIYSRDLTEVQVLKLYKKGIWDRVRALAWLQAQGVKEDEANNLLDSA